MIRSGALRPLFDAHLRQATGTLEARDASGVWRIGLRAGAVVQVLGRPDLLQSRGLTGEGDLARDLGAAVAAGISADDAFSAAELGLAEALLTLAEDPRGRLRFDGTALPPRRAFPLPSPMLRMLARAFGARHGGRDPELDGRRLSWRGPAEIRGLNPVEQRVALCARKRMGLGEALQSIGRGSLARERQAWATVELMVAVGLLELEAPPSTARVTRATARDREADERVRALREKIARRKRGQARTGAPSAAGAPPSAGARSAGGARRGARGDGASELERILASEAALREREPLEILGLHEAPTLDLATLTAAFRDVGARYHPDRYAAAPAELREATGRVFALISSAFDALREPEALERARLTLEARARGEVYVDPVSAGKARVYFRKAEAAFRGRNRAAAAELIEAAVALDPRPIEYHILQIFCRVFSRTLDPEDGLEQLSALSPKTSAERIAATFARARLLKFLDRNDEAIAAFREVLALDPDHQDARREVWLHERRSGGSETTALRMLNIFGRRG